MGPMILSHFQVRPMWAARQRGAERVVTSLDLGLTSVEVELRPDGVRLAEDVVLSWMQLNEISEAEVSCFQVIGGAIKKLHGY